MGLFAVFPMLYYKAGGSMPAKKVTVPVPESLYQWLSDTSEKDYRTVPQQIVFLCAHAFEGFIPALEVKPNVAVALDAAVRPEPAAAQPAVGSVSAAVAGQSRFVVLAKPPDGKVTTIHVHGYTMTEAAEILARATGALYDYERLFRENRL